MLPECFSFRTYPSVLINGCAKIYVIIQIFLLWFSRNQGWWIYLQAHSFNCSTKIISEQIRKPLKRKTIKTEQIYRKYISHLLSLLNNNSGSSVNQWETVVFERITIRVDYFVIERNNNTNVAQASPVFGFSSGKYFIESVQFYETKG